ncbi:MAG: hypothetical protein JST67_03960 [Bacteroidetes bacterium]|nr:hypothetical protein [Bacteroidota bacterium]
MEKTKKILLTLVCAALGGIFIFSAYTKIYPIEPFEYTFVDLHIANWVSSQIIARLLIGLEFLIGALLIANMALKKITYKLSATTLLLFCIYLIFQIILNGNTGNCGCFGTEYYMSPLAALIKNLIMLAVLALLYFNHTGFNFKKATKVVLITLVIISFALPFILNRMEFDHSASYTQKTQIKADLDSLYLYAYNGIPPKTLSKGKQVMLFFSLTCKHCRIAAKKAHIMHEANPNIPFYMVLNGKYADLPDFYADTHTQNIAHCMLKGSPFTYLAGFSLPTIYLINNSFIEHTLVYIELDQAQVEKWLQQP